MKHFSTILILILLSYCKFSFSQDYHIQWEQRSDLNKARNLDKVIHIDSNHVLFIEKSNSKPSGLKPILYTYDKDDNTLDAKYIEGRKHMQVYKDFFTSTFQYQTINGKTYRIELDFEKDKPDNDIYSCILREIDMKSLSSVGEEYILLDNITTSNSGGIFTFSNNDYLYVIKSGGDGELFSNGKGIDVHIFETTSFELIRSEKISLSTEEKTGELRDMELNKKGELIINVLLKDKNWQYSKDTSPSQLLYINTSKDSTTQNQIDITEVCVATKLDEGDNFIITVGADDSKKSISLSTFMGLDNTSSVRDNYIITLEDIIRKENSNYSHRFSETIAKSEKIFIAENSSKIHTVNDGTIAIFELVLRPEKGLGISNLLFCTVVCKVNQQGKFIWCKLVPTSHLFSLLDQEDNLIILSNGIADEYNNEGDYTPNNITEVNAEVVPVILQINFNNGEIMKHQVFSGDINENEAFSAFGIGFQIDEHTIFIGKNLKTRANSMSSDINNGIIYGVMTTK